MSSSRHRTIPLLLAAALVLAACTGETTDSGEAATTSPPTTIAAASSPPQPPATTTTEPTVTPPRDDPADVINDYVAAYNSSDVGEVMELFTEDSAITGHPTGSGLANGLAEIQVLHVQDLSFGRGYTISNVETSGNTVAWDTVWGDNYGCVEGHTTVTNGDKIVSWTWGTVFDCP
jgi:hypothetical protein